MRNTPGSNPPRLHRRRHPVWGGAAGAFRLIGMTVIVVAASLASAAEPDPDLKEAWDQLEALGYLATGEDAAPADGGEPPVRIHVEGSAYAGPTYFSSGHASKAFLIDMDGRILHEWEYVLSTVVEPKRRFWRRMYVYPNGDALAVFEAKGGGIAKIDAQSNELWARTNGAHHDLQVMDDGSIFVLTRTVEIDPEIDRRLPIHHDRVTRLSADGEVLQEWSVVDALRGTPWESQLVYRDKGDLLHTNALEVLDGSHTGGHRAFRAGRILLSFWGTDALALLDPIMGKIVWYEKGPWRGQHQPSLLANGNILLLNNNPVVVDDSPVDEAGEKQPGPSEILEYDPVVRKVVWRYAGTAGEKNFFTSLSGSVALLPNGNYLASLSFQSRAVEITREGRIVWEYRSPFVIDGKVAHTPEFVRLPADFPIDWARPGVAK
jgi:hypothetical protein